MVNGKNLEVVCFIGWDLCIVLECEHFLYLQFQAYSICMRASVLGEEKQLCCMMLPSPGFTMDMSCGSLVVKVLDY